MTLQTHISDVLSKLSVFDRGVRDTFLCCNVCLFVSDGNDLSYRRGNLGISLLMLGGRELDGLAKIPGDIPGKLLEKRG